MHRTPYVIVLDSLSKLSCLSQKNTFVGSILNYCGGVLGLNEAKDIELIHTKFCRWVLHVRKSTNLTGLYGELGRVPFIVHRKIRMISYWMKLLALDNHAVPKKIYTMLKTYADNNFLHTRQGFPRFLPVLTNLTSYILIRPVG